MHIEGISSPNKDYAIKLFDSIYMIAFINDNKLIQYIDLPTRYITFVEKMDNQMTVNLIYLKKILCKFIILGSGGAIRIPRAYCSCIVCLKAG